MLSYAFSDEQLQFRDVLNAFARKTLSPGYIGRAASTVYPMDVRLTEPQSGSDASALRTVPRPEAGVGG